MINALSVTAVAGLFVAFINIICAMAPAQVMDALGKIAGM